MVLQSKTVRKIEKLTNHFFDTAIFVEARSFDQIKKSYPWHSVFFSPEAAVAAVKERSVVTKIGQSFIQPLARIVAEDKFKDVRANSEIWGEIDAGVLDAIEKICRELRGEIKTPVKRRPNHDLEVKEILKSKKGKKVKHRIVADLFIGDFHDKKLFYEIKAPMPNLDQTENAKRKILQFITMDIKRNIAFFALHYNPYITRTKYKWSFTKSIMDFQKQVLVGEEMWDFIGGKGCYEEIISILSRVGETKWKEFKQKQTPTKKQTVLE